MKILLLALFVSVQVLSVSAVADEAAAKMPSPFKIVPEPQEIELLPGNGIMFGDLVNLRMIGDFDRPVMGAILSPLTASDASGEGTLTLRLDDSGDVPNSSEGYLLTIANGNVEIIASGEAGIFYGCQTLEQLLEDARDFQTAIPSCRITDSPALSYRAVHIDVKHHLDHMNIYYESIDRLARYKINGIIFEFEDKLRYELQPQVAAPESININEMAALTNYARRRHIEITPLVQGLGHATFILKHDQYAHLRELPENRWAFCPMDDGTYEVLFDLYRDAIKATPGSRYLHIGGDEIGNIGLCHRCGPTAEKEGLLSLNLYWLTKVSDFAKENGRIPIFWDDMPLKAAGVYESTWTDHPDEEQAAKEWEVGGPILEELIQKFPEECIYMRWNYGMAREPGNIMALDWYRDHGLKTMIATLANPSSTTVVAAIRSFVTLAAEKGIDGNLCTAWDDHGHHMETYWRGYIASAEYGWNPEGRTEEEFYGAYLQREFGTTMPDYEQFKQELWDAESFWLTSLNREGSRVDLDNALLILPGLAHWFTPDTKMDQDENAFKSLLIELPDSENPGKWSSKYEQRINEAKKIADEYQLTSKALTTLNQQSRRNRYHWEVIEALNDFHITAPRLLLALEQCDRKKKKRPQDAVENVREALNEFQQSWKNLETVYAKTRFLNYSADFVPDRFFHFASQREDLTWMIQVEELLHPMVEEWLDRIN
ncbi:MAG: hypothetical protein DHS20C17_24990 [Cyclobacteriaceae bacterium]|nr:MAG: hypothetical protein DHS20C17_24990 [Cyclobacteriaceae bacterium]